MKHMTWIEINRSYLEHNIAQYKSWLPRETMIAPVIKANAYGHGISEIASIHENNQLVNKLCVTNTEEGLILRQDGIKKNILVLSYINSRLSDVILNNLEITISDMATLHELNKAALQLQQKIKIHLKVDTGMSRLGILPHEVNTYLNEITLLPGLELIGIWSHLSDAKDKHKVQQQEQLFQTINNKKVAELHIANSLGSLHTHTNYSFSRVGIGQYGYLLAPDEYRNKLKPILSLKTRIIHIKDIPAHTSVGYMETYKTTKPTKLAVLSLGYYDGLNSNLIRGGKVILHNQYAPIISINMNLTTIDITHIPHCKKYDTVTILGNEQSCELSAYNWQSTLHKNIRELLSRLEKTLPRIIVSSKTKII